MVDRSRVQAHERLAQLPSAAIATHDAASALKDDAVLLANVLIAAEQSASGGVDLDVEDLAAALSLFGHMRRQIDQLEVDVVIQARRQGMAWPEISRAQGLGSPQAAAQRYQRMVTRLEEIRQGLR